MVSGKINLQRTRVDITTKEIEESVWLDEIQKIKDKNKQKTETSNES